MSVTWRGGCRCQGRGRSPGTPRCSLPHLPHLAPRRCCPGPQLSCRSGATLSFRATSYSIPAKRSRNRSWLMDFFRALMANFSFFSTFCRRQCRLQLAEGAGGTGVQGERGGMEREPSRIKTISQAVSAAQHIAAGCGMRTGSTLLAAWGWHCPLVPHHPLVPPLSPGPSACAQDGSGHLRAHL